jgi:hypothetical protein
LFELFNFANLMDLPGLLDLGCVTVVLEIRNVPGGELRRVFNRRVAREYGA